MKKIAVVLASVIIAACASPEKTNSTQATQTNEQSKSSIAATANSTASTGVDQAKLASELDALQKQSDYFDYNKYDIKPEFQSVLQNEAKFIKEHRNDFVVLEGSADERGSKEYNYALSEKRAEAVQKSLLKLGVSASQFKLVGLGKDKPRLSCHEEKCWKENRRVDFVHKLS